MPRHMQKGLMHLLLPAVALGVVQGLTEFLPVSSSGHLVIASHLLRFAEPSLLFDTLLHVGTLLPVLWLYRADLCAILRGLRRFGAPARAWREDRGFRLLVCVVIGTAPTALIGLTLGGLFTRLFGSPTVVGVTFLVTGGILMASRLSPQPLAQEEPEDSHLSLSAARALWVGLAQGVAITPGISRSGTTITAALLLGIERTMAARLSFLLSIPAILGAVLLQLRGPLSSTGWSVYLAGALAAALSGYLALRWLVGLVRRGSFHRFAFYVWPLGLAVLAYTLFV
jgi:undecaprenyl-diphosphatase